MTEAPGLGYAPLWRRPAAGGRSHLRSGLRGVVAISLLAMALFTGVPGSVAFHVVPMGQAAMPTAASGACRGGAASVNFPVQVVAVGPPSSPPPVTNVSVSLAYYYQMSHVPNGGSTTVSCQPGSVKNSTDPTGNVRLVAVLPSGSCDRVSCNYYTGPFGPVAFGLPGGLPPGY